MGIRFSRILRGREGMTGFKCLLFLGSILALHVVRSRDLYDDDIRRLSELRQDDPSYFLQVLSNMRARLPNEMAPSKRGIDFGLGRGFSGSQAAKHFMGMAAARYSGGPGKRKR